MSAIHCYAANSSPWDVTWNGDDIDVETCFHATGSDAFHEIQWSSQDSDDVNSQSTHNGCHTFDPSFEMDTDNWRHEQKHLPPVPPAFEHSMILDDDSSHSPWTIDDSPPWSPCYQLSYNDPDVQGLLDDRKPRSNNTESSFMSCAECGRRFDNYQKMEKHGKVESHLPFECEWDSCKKRLARRDTMQRHMAKHKEPQFSCQWCNREGISKLFTRKDHCKSHESKCAHRPATDHTIHQPSHFTPRSEARRHSTILRSITPTLPLEEADLKRKIKDFMDPMVPRNKVQARLDTLGPAEMQALYLKLASTVLDGSCAGEMRKIRPMEVSS